MSTLKADTIQSTSGGAATLTKQSAAKAWNRFDGASVPTIAASFNNSSMADNGTGTYTVNFTSSMSDANYAPVCGGARDPSVNGVAARTQNPDTITASAFDFNAFYVDSGGLEQFVDDGILFSAVDGDLA